MWSCSCSRPWKKGVSPETAAAINEWIAGKDDSAASAAATEKLLALLPKEKAEECKQIMDAQDILVKKIRLVLRRGRLGL